MFDESADNILALDVKKRHCQLPKETRNNLQAIVKTHQQKSISAWETVGKKVQEKRGENKDKYANESIANTPVGDLNYSPGTDLDSSVALQKRQQLLEVVRLDTLKNINDRHISQESLEKKAEDKSFVIFVDGLKGNAMWLPYPSINFGFAETLINQLHSWLATAYAAAENKPQITIILHQLVTILARAELEVRSTDWPDLPLNAADRVLERFRKKVSVIGEDLAESLANELAKLDNNQGKDDE